MEAMKRLVLGVALVALLWVCGVAGAWAQEESRPFVTKWQFEAGKGGMIQILGKYKLVITAPSGVDEIKIESQTDRYSFTPKETGEYTVTAGPEGVSGMNMLLTSSKVQKALKEVVDFGTVKWEKMSGFFFGCENMTFADGIKPPDLTKVEDMSTMFYKCTAFNSSIANWNVSQVTDMREMFSGCTAFNQPLNNWNVSKVTNMSEMFNSCSAFNQPLNNWNVGSVTDMRSMFKECIAFNQPLNNWNVSKVNNMRSMFSACSAFNQPLNDWKVGSVTDMSYMFGGCKAFNQPLNNWNVSSVTNMNSMFEGCTAFNQPLNNWNVGSVTNMSYMFKGCSAFNQPLGNWKLTTAIGGLNRTAMSTENYSQSLVGWAAQTELENISLNVNGLTYNDAGKTAHETLEGRGWTFNGDSYKAKGVKINANNLFLAVNEERKIAVEKWGVAEDATVEVTVKGANPNAIEIVKAYDGKTVTIKGKRVGNFTLKAKIESESLVNACSGEVKVVDVTALHVTPWTKKLNRGESFPLLIDVQPANASEKAVTITNSNTSVATYDEATGMVTATDKKGTTTITVKMAAAGSTIPPVSCTVEVVAPVYAVALETNTEEGELSIEGKDAAALKAVEKGSTLKVLVVPKEGYKLTSLKAVGASGNATDLFALSDYTFTVNENTTVKATFEKRKLKVSVTKEGGNEACTFEVVGKGSDNLDAVEYGAKLQINTTEATGYQFKELKSDDVAIEGNKFEVKSEKDAIEVKVVFELKKFDITTEVVAGKAEGCSIQVNGQESLTGVGYGTTVTVTETCADGWELQSLTVDGVDIKESKTFVVKKTVIVKATFEKRKLKVSVTKEGGNEGCTFEVEGSANLGAVEYGTKLQVKVTAEATGYQFKELKIDEVAIEGKTFEVKSEKNAIEVKVVFELKKFDITTEVVAGKEEGCSIKINGQESLTGIDYGTTVTVTETHAAGWELQSLTVDGVDIKESKTFVVKKTVSVKATFKKEDAKTYKVILTPTTYATLSIKNYDTEALNAVAENTELEVEVTKITAGYELKELTANGVDIKETKKFTVTKATTVTATFELRTFEIKTEVVSGQGTLTLTNADHPEQNLNLKAVPYGTKIAVTATGATEGNWQLSTLEVGKDNIYSTGVFTVTEAVTVKATFISKTAEKYKVTLTQGANGTIAIEGYTEETLKTVAKDTELTVVETPDNGYELKELKANGVDIKATKKFTVTADTEVTAVFGKKEGNDNNDQEPLAVEESLLASLAVSPNPFTVQLRIGNPEGVAGRYELVNLSGVVVRSGVINGSEVIIDTEALPTGLYFARLMGQNGAKRVEKVIKY